MKAKLHIELNQFEFIEFEFDEKDSLDTEFHDSLYEKYHKRGEKLLRKPLPKRPIGQRPKDEIDQLSHLDGDHYNENGI